MQSGAVRGYVGALTGIITDIQKELGGNARVVATGGMGRMMAKYCDLIDDVDPNLTLEGLRLIYEHNREAFENRKLNIESILIEETEEDNESVLKKLLRKGGNAPHAKAE